MRNLRRSPFRSLGIGAAMAVMSGSLLAVVVTLAAAGTGVGRGAGRLGADIVVVPRAAAGAGGAGSSTRYMDYAVVEQLKQVQIIVPQYGGRPPLKVPGVAAASPQLSLVVPDAPSAGAPGLRVTGFEPASDLTVLPWLARPLGRPLGPGDALVGYALARAYREAVEVAGERFTVVGVLGRTEAEEMDRSVFVQLPTAWRLLQRIVADAPDGSAVPFARPVTSVAVRSRPDAESQRVANFIVSTMPDLEPRVAHEAMTALGTQLRASIGNLGITAAVIWLTAALLVGSAFSMVVRERQRELGLLRAMGATRGDLLGLLALEVLAVCTAGGAVGVAGGLGALAGVEGLIATQLGLQYEWPGAGRLLALALLCLAAAPLTGLLAALAPTLRAATLEPHVAINDAR
jgi:putative ABC transport system permease protein